MKENLNKNFLKTIKKKFKIKNLDKLIFILLLLVSMFFLINKFFGGHSNIYTTRNDAQYTRINNIKKEEVYEENTPEGIKQEYTWNLDNNDNKDYIQFFALHQNVNVYIDNHLIYSSNLHNTRQIGKTLGQLCVIIPIYQEVNGSQIRVEIIPLYKQVLNNQPEFWTGTKFMFYYRQFKEDLLQIILSFISVGISILFFSISIINKYEKKRKNNLFYLGIFAFSLGVWRITDIKFTSMVYWHNSEIIYYICMLMLYISAGALGLSIKKQFIRKYKDFMKYLIIIYSSICLSLIFMQIINLYDLRESLIVWHILVIICSIIVAVLVFYETPKSKNVIRVSNLYIFMILCLIGVLLDFIFYYVKGNSDSLLITLVALIIYSIVLGYISINKINEKANLDIQTGLYNKRRLKEFFINYETVDVSLGIMMFDLNGLKHTNDTLGHNYGDVLISEFAKILKVCIKHKGFVARFGGDEFVAIIKNADKNLIKQIEFNINAEVEKYNTRNSGILISYSIGYALSNEYPELSLHELLAKADAYMYWQKKEYYKNKNNNDNE